MIGRGGAFERGVDPARVGAVGAGEDVEGEAGVADAAGEGALDGHELAANGAAAGGRWVVRGDAAGGGAQADDAVAIGGVADGAGDVVAVVDRAKAGGGGRAGAAGRAAGGAGLVARVDGVAVQGVFCEQAHREGRGVGAADDDGAGAAEVFDQGGVFLGDVVAERFHAVVGGVALLVGVDLGGDGDAVQRAEGVPAVLCRVRCCCGGEGFIVQAADDGVDGGVDRVDAGEDGFGRLCGGDLAGADQPCEVNAVELPEFGHGSPLACTRGGDGASLGRDCHPRKAGLCPDPLGSRGKTPGFML